MSLYKIQYFSYEDVDFWQIIYITLYPSLEYSTTHTTIIQKHENSYDDESLPRPNTTSILINGRVLPTSSEVFDHIFKQQ